MRESTVRISGAFGAAEPFDAQAPVGVSGRDACYDANVAVDDADAPWDVRILRAIDFGVDESLVAARLRLTPTERVESMRRALIVAEDLRAAVERAKDGHRLP